MFHKRTGQTVAILMLLSVSLQPMTSHAAEPSPAVATADAAPLATVKHNKKEEFSLEALRKSSKAKLSDTHDWMKDKTQGKTFKAPIKTLELKIDRLQDRVKPAGRSLKTSMKKHAPGKRLVHLGDRTFSVYGILLMLAFGLVILSMSLSGPASRLGGRH